MVEQMAQGNYNLGGEQSGHLIFLDYNTTGDGILSALQVAAVMLRENLPLSELKRIMQRYPQTMINVRVKERRSIETIPEVASALQRHEQGLGDEGRILVRPSGTEPVIRVMVEGADQQRIETIAEELAHVIHRHLGS
ncbi:MAG TPA: hypothetical protein DCE18_12165 [Syntrophobacteraceae bacterium]|nr:hypothetical protein [Syntrophobacteraceae bacterium]